MLATPGNRDMLAAIRLEGIAQARQMIAGFGERFETTPLSGPGLNGP